MLADKAAPCRHAGVLSEDIIQRAVNVITALSRDETYLAKHGLSASEYAEVLPTAIERIRGRAAASNSDRRQFLIAIFQAMTDRNILTNFKMPRYGEDTVYRLTVPNIGDIAVIQKGCPDGTHSSVQWTVPSWAVETYLWWSCPSLAHHPGTHVGLGVNRLKTKFFSIGPDDAEARMIDGVIFHNELCGTPQRPCPKLNRALELQGKKVPPPCIYVFPKCEVGALNWNWDGGRQLIFPALLLELFGIRAEEVPAFTGHVGFQSKGDQIRTTISARYGLGRSTTFRG